MGDQISKKNQGRVRCEICPTWYKNLLPSYIMIVLEDVLRCIGGGISKWINGMKYNPDIDSWIYGSLKWPTTLIWKEGVLINGDRTMWI